MEKLDLGSILDSAKQMGNHFKAFKKINEIIQTITLSEQIISENNLIKGLLFSEINELTGKKKNLEAEILNLQDLTKKQASKIEELKKSVVQELDDMKSEYQKESESIKSQISALNISLNLKKEEVSNEIESLESQRKEAQINLDNLKAELEQFKKSIVSIGG